MNGVTEDNNDVLGLRQIDFSLPSNNMLFDPSVARLGIPSSPAPTSFNFHVPVQFNKFPTTVFTQQTQQQQEPQIVTATATPSFFDFDPSMASYESLMASALFAKAEDKSPSDPNVNGKSDFYDPAMGGFDLMSFSTSAYATATRLADAAQVDPDYHQYLHAALFNGEDEDEGVPELEPDVPENDVPEDHLIDFETLAKETIAQQLHHKTPASNNNEVQMINFNTSPQPSSTSTPGSEYLPEPSPAVVATAPVRARKATGFRGAATPLIPVDAPIQARNYATESTTSRKRKTVAIERKLAKRLATPKPEVDDEEIPEDLLEAAERKRLQNTLSARKSRLRKQERLGELEEENKILRSEKAQMASRIEDLEKMLREMGVNA